MLIRGRCVPVILVLLGLGASALGQVDPAKGEVEDLIEVGL